MKKKRSKKDCPEKPMPVQINCYGSMLSLKIDPKMTNIWINSTLPINYKDAKDMRDWLNRYIKYIEYNLKIKYGGWE